jgi:VWFA-related protein
MLIPMPSSRLTRLLAGFFASLLVVSWSVSQEKSDPGETDASPAETGVVEKVDVHLVQIPIIAQDRNGRPISDLTPEEVVVKDRGKKMEVAFLDPFVSEIERPGPDGEVRLYVNAPGGWDGVVTSEGDAEPRYMVLLIDIENDAKLRRPAAMAEVKQFVDDQLDSSFRTAVMSYNGHINQELSFTSNKEAIHSAVLRAYSRAPRPDLDLNARVRGLISQFEECQEGETTPYSFQRDADEICLRNVALQYSDERRQFSKDYLDALEVVIRYAGGLKGRKSVLALSHGVAAEATTEALEAMKAYFGNTEQVSTLRLSLIAGEGSRIRMDEIMNLAVRQQVTLHFVDRNSAPTGVTGVRQDINYMPGARPMQAAFEAPQVDLEEIATHTGGVFVHSPQEVYKGLTHAINLEQGGYLLGYYVSEYLSPKRLRKVSVGCKRKGVEVVHRRGYYSSRESSGRALNGGIRLGKGVPLEDDGREGLFMPFKIVVDPETLGYQEFPDAGAAEATLTVHFRVETEEGRPLADSYHFLSHAYPLELWEKGDVEPIIINGWVELPPYDYRLVAVVRNARTGVGGELTTAVSVPAAETGTGPAGRRQ